MRCEGFFVPGLTADDHDGWGERAYADGQLRLDFPLLTQAGVSNIVDRLRRARLEAQTSGFDPVRVVRAIDRAAALLADDADPLRQEAEEALPRLTGFSPAMVRHVLDGMVRDWRAAPLDRLLRAEFDDPAVLREFRPARPPVGDGASSADSGSGEAPGQTRRLTRAIAPRLAFHVFSGNVPGVAVTSLIRATLVGAASFAKTASGEPLLPVLFARALARVDPQLGNCVAVTYWPGGSEALEEVAIRSADLVIFYGGAAAERTLRGRLPPGKRWVSHGPRLSVALVAREALAAGSGESSARSAALATGVFDQHGCVSPHAFYVERGGEWSPQQWAECLAQKLDELHGELPRGSLEPAEHAAIHEARGAAEFRALGGAKVRVFSGVGTDYTVIYDEDAAFRASTLNRVVRVHPLDDLEQVFSRLRPVAGLLQTVGIAGPPSRRRGLAEGLAELGAARITDLEGMPWPPPWWHHDGSEPLRELVRWVDLDD